MRANIEFENDYIKSLKSSPDGEYELPKDFDISLLNCYYIIRKSKTEYEFVLDETKANQVVEDDEKDTEIQQLETKLNNSDYIIAQAFEEVLALNNPLTFVADIIKIMIKYSTKYKDTLANRKTWRNRIQELRG